MIDLKKIPKTEFAVAVAQIAGERNIDIEVVIDSVQSAILAAFKRDARERGEEINEEADYRVVLNSETGKAKIVLVNKAGKEKDVTPSGFGRIAAQIAKQVILQKIREAEKSAVMAQFKSRIGTLANGIVLRVEGPRVIVAIGKAEAIMPKEERIRSEHYFSSQRLPFYLKELIEEEDKKAIIVSRSAPELVTELFRREVPEVNSGAVEIRKIARRPGERTKIAVFSTRPGVDPVGSCVGQKGIRVQAVIRELSDEKVDVIPFSDDIRQFIASALSPASDVEIEEIDEKKKQVIALVREDQLAMAIGEGGENVSLAGQLTGYEIKVKAREEKEKKKKEKKLKSKLKTKKAKGVKAKKVKKVKKKKKVEKKKVKAKKVKKGSEKPK